jgi:prepilin-type N-terminal cleavage/methylation domain-containing protein
MKTKRDPRQAAGDTTKLAERNTDLCHAAPVLPHAHAFTLIELLTVIAVIAILAAFTIPVLSAVKRRQYLSEAQAEMTQLETAIQKYHDTLGFYPPDNGDTASDWYSARTNQLYYELSGMTNTSPANVTPAVFQTLDGSAQLDGGQAQSVFHVGGFVNCSKPGSGEDTPAGRNFLPELKPNQLGTFPADGVWITNLITAVGGPDTSYKPLGVQGLNPWRYKSSGTLTNNPGSYELWVQLVISGKTNLICNWSQQVQINSTLP